jgi:16S rRNA (cytosine1402-N4)-methyltransferase
MGKTGIGPEGVAHVPVMVAEVVAVLRPRPGARLIDATLGLGGHAAALLHAAPGSSLLGVDPDPAAIARARIVLAPFATRIVLRQGSYADLAEIMADVGWDRADAVLLDLGVSSAQLDDPSRGFSFRAPGPLDMRFDPAAAGAAGDIVNAWPEEALARLIREYGEEPRARAVARAIVHGRPIATTTELAALVSRVLGRTRPGLHPVTRTFQALRIAVNDELRALDRVLADGYRVLAAGGRLAVIAYHSLEDRRAKVAFRRWAAACVCPPRAPRCACGWTRKVRVLTPRPVRPDSEEVARNPRARSARLRAVERFREDA